MKDETNKKLLSAFTGEPLVVTIKHDKFEGSKEFTIKQPTLRMLIETSKILEDIGISEIEQLFQGRNIFEFIAKHGDKVAKLISIALDYNIDYSKTTYELVMNGLDVHEMYDLLLNVVARIGTGDFQKSIIATSAMSLTMGREIIAFSTPLNSLAAS